MSTLNIFFQKKMRSRGRFIGEVQVWSRERILEMLQKPARRQYSVIFQDVLLNI